MLRHLMLVPSLACPASCAYCFGPHAGGPPMTQATLEAVVRWQNVLGAQDPLEITFHGGEPLIPGISLYRMALPLLREGLAPRKVRFVLQSNLWLLTDGLCDLFREHEVSLGTSLDGPETINDAQRGNGYFRRTMAGIERARAHGLSVGCICTFTLQSAPYAKEVFDFFAHAGLSFNIHASLPSMQHPDTTDWALAPEVYGELLVNMLDRYLENLDQVRIGTLDSLCKSVSAGHGGICAFGDCLGEYLSIAPGGEIYSCQRFAGMPAYQLGSVHECPTPEKLSTALAWRMLHDRQTRIEEECGGCPNLAICRGGCPYSVLATYGSLDRTLRDPYCASYQRIFSHIVDRAAEEVFSEENLNAVINAPDSETNLLRQGKLLSIMKDGPHPYEAAQRARRALAAVALATTDSPMEATRRFQRLELVNNLELTERGMQALYQSSTAAFQKRGQPIVGLNQRCQDCALRYLCVEIYDTKNCQREQIQDVLDAPPKDCASLYRRARSLLADALEHQGVSAEQWMAAGLPLPEPLPAAE